MSEENKIVYEYEYIYKCSFYESKRHSVSYSDMYWTMERFTRWCHDNELAKVFVIKVDKDSNEYKSARHNDKESDRKENKAILTDECLKALSDWEKKGFK